MNLTHKSLIALASLVTAMGAAQAQSGGTSKNEMDRGVPGVDVDVGRNANGAIDVNTNRDNANRGTTKSEMDRGVPGVDVNVGRNANGAIDVNTAAGNNNRAPRADRN